MNTKIWLTNWKNTVLRSRRAKRTRRNRQGFRQTATEVLEPKTLLTGLNCLGQIEGTMFNDLTEDGLTGDDVRIGGATVHLYLDGGNGTFESSDGVQGGDDVFQATTTTNAVTGEYSFSDLAAGTYFVEQDSGLTGFIQRPGADVVTVVVSASDADGTAGTTIDGFTDPVGSQAVSATTGVPDSSTATIAGVGTERDLFVEQSGTGTLSTVELRANQIPGFAELVSAFGTTGRGTVTWDGADGDATTLDATGLSSVDLTDGGDSTGLLVDLGASNAVTVMNVTVYTDAANYSTASVTIANTGALTTESVFLNYLSDFSVGAGTGADFTNVGAITMELDATAQVSTTVVASVIQAHGPTKLTANLINSAPMTLGGSIFRDTNNNGVFQSGTESTISGVDVTLFEDTNSDGAFDGGDTQLATGTSVGGDYSFTNLFPGEYIVRVDASNFAGGGTLEDLVSSTGNGVAPDPDNNVNDDDNGDHIGGVTTNAITTQAITLVNGTEPTNDGDSDNNTNLSLDIGVFGTVDIEVTKSDNVDPVIAGSGTGNLVYTVTATNNGPTDATGVAITDAFLTTLPSGFSLVSGVGTGTTTFASGTGIWTIGNLADGDTETLTVTITVDETAAAGTVTNTATVSAVNESDSDSSNDTANEDTTVARQVDIAVTKSDNVDPVTAGSGTGNLVYTVTATNNGPSNATGVAVTDALMTSLPAGFSLVSGTGTGTTTFASGTGIWTIGNLDSGDTETLTLTLTIGASAASGTITNTATVSAVTETDTNSANDTANEDTTVARQVDIAVTKADNVDPVTAGSGAGNLVYTVTATNNGPSDATGVQVTDALMAALPTGFSLVSGVGTGTTTFASGTGIWTIGDLDSGDTETLTLTLTVGVSAASGTITNTAAVTAVTETDSNSANDTANEDTTVGRDVDIAVTKSDNADPVTAGSGTGNLIYTVVATNNGPSDATGVQVTDALIASLPTGFTFVLANDSGSTSFDETTGIWNIGNMASGASETLIVTLTAGASAAAGTITNTAIVTSVNEPDTNSANDTANEDTTIVRSVDIAVTKGDNVDPVTAGSGASNLIYTVTATNNGPSDASGVEITDALIAALPTGFSLDSAAGTNGTTFVSGTGVWTIGDMASGATETLTVTLTVGDTAATGTVVNTANVTGVNETETTTANNVAVEDTTIVREVDIAVTKSDNVDPVTAGSGTGNLVYTVNATNNGPSNATGVAVTDALIASLPTGFSLVSATGSGSTTFDSGTGIWSIGNLNDGQTATLTVTLTVSASAATGTITNTATVSSVTETDTNSANDTANEDTTIARSIDIAVTKSDNVDPVTAGSGTGNLVYTVTATNNGPSNATGVQITDALIASLPTGFSLVSATGSGTTSFASGTGLWAIGDLDQGATETLTVTLTVGASATAGTITNTALVSAVTETDSDNSNDTANEDTTVVRSVDVAVVKTDSADPITAGSGASNLTYTVTATNNGPSDASGLAITDAFIAGLPTGFSLVSGTGTGGSTFDDSTGIWSIGSLPTGDSESLTLILTVDHTATAGTVTNTATVSGLNETDTNSANDTDTEDTTIVRQVDIGVTKTDSSDPVIAGSGAGNLIYTLVATNNGPSGATGVEITDALLANLPSGITFVSVNGTGGSTFNSGNGIWTIGDLASGDSRELTVTLTVGESVEAGTITNVATVTGVNETDSNPSNDTDSEETTITREIDLVVTKTDQVDPIQSPGTITYTITVENNGPSTATNVVVTDTLSSLVTFDSVTSTQGSSVENGGVLTSMLGTIAAGADATITLIVNVDQPAGGTINNIAVVTASETETDTTNNTDDEVTTVLPEPSSVSGVVYQDLNNNGVQDNDEPPIEGAQVGLFGTNVNGEQIVQVVRTDATGAYVFSDLLQGDYNLFEVQPGIFLDGTDTAGTGAPATALDDAFIDLDLAPGANAVAFNFGEGLEDEEKRDFLASRQLVNQEISRVQAVTGTGSLSGTVALDKNRNGVFDAGDTGIPAAHVALVGTDNAGNAVLIYRTTDNDGSYAFEDLAEGNYSIVETQPPGYSDSVEETGSLLPDSVTDDVFASIALPDGVAGTGFNFMELPAAADTTGSQVPVLNTQIVERGSQPTLSWSSVDGADHYDVWVSQLSGSNTGLVYRNQNVGGTSVQVTNDLQLATHRVWVRAIDAQGQPMPWSRDVTFDVTPDVTVISPTGSTIDTSPNFDWQDVPDATSYDFVLQDDVGNEVARGDDLTSSTFAQTTNLPVGTYRFWIRSKNADVTGQWSGGNVIEISATPIIVAPVSASVLADPLLEWTDSGAEYYEVWINDITSGSTHMGVENVNGTAMLLDHGMTDGHSYRFWVRGMDNEGNASEWSAPQTFTMDSSTKVTGPTGNVSTGTPTITWDAVPGATHYYLWVSNDSGAFLRDQNVSGTSYTPTTAFPDGDYRVWVQPFGLNGAGTWSSASQFSVGGLDTPVITGPVVTTSDRTPTFTWDAVTDADRYELWVNHLGVTSRVIHETSLTANSYTPATNLAAGDYRIWVRALSTSGQQSAWSAAVNVSIT